MIVLGNVQCLQRFPGPHRLLPRGSFFRSQEVTHEVDVSPVEVCAKGSLVWFSRMLFFDQISVREFDAVDELLFPPTIEAVTQAWLNPFLPDSFVS